MQLIDIYFEKSFSRSSLYLYKLILLETKAAKVTFPTICLTNGRNNDSSLYILNAILTHELLHSP